MEADVFKKIRCNDVRKILVLCNRTYLMQLRHDCDNCHSINYAFVSCKYQMLHGLLKIIELELMSEF